MLKRHIEARLLASLSRFPVVLLLGARGVGKSTLVESLCQGAWSARCLNLDDPDVHYAVGSNAERFLRDIHDPVAIDEVQRAPDLLMAIARRVLRDPRPGRFLLTASADAERLDSMSQIVGERMVVHRLAPPSWREWLGLDPFPILDRLFEVTEASQLLHSLPQVAPAALADEIRRFLLVGMLPAPATLEGDSARGEWFESYRRTVVGDLGDLASVSRVTSLERMLQTLNLATSTSLNLTKLAHSLELAVVTVRRHFQLLEQVFQVERLNPSVATPKRVRRPKIHVLDTGLACHLTGVTGWSELERRSQVEGLLKTWVFGELMKLVAVSTVPTDLQYWQAREREVDFLVERQDRVVGIQVKWTESSTPWELQELAQCRESLGPCWHLGVLLHGGTEARLLDERTVSLPLATFFGAEAARDPGTAVAGS